MTQGNRQERIPWERKEEIGYLLALWETIKEVLLGPSDFFGKLKIKDSYSQPLSFYFLISLPVGIISFTWDLLLGRPGAMNLPLPPAIYLLILPVLIVAFLFIASAILHVCILIFGGKGDFKCTFEVLAYGGAAGIFCIVPFIGWLISIVWGITVAIIGFKIIHRMSTARAMFAYLLLPMVLFVLMLATAIFMPSVLKAKSKANESTAEATVRTISAAIETYKVANGRYPANEFDLRYSQPPYLSRGYDREIIDGYYYSVAFGENGYEVIAEPEVCGRTGDKYYRAITDAKISEGLCEN